MVTTARTTPPDRSFFRHITAEGVGFAHRVVSQVSGPSSPLSRFLAQANQLDGPVRLRDALHPLKFRLIRTGFSLPNKALYTILHGRKKEFRVPGDVRVLLDKHHNLLMATDLQNTVEGIYPRALLHFPAREYAGAIPDLVGAAAKVTRRHSAKDAHDIPDLPEVERTLGPKLTKLGLRGQDQITPYVEDLREAWKKYYGQSFHYLGWIDDGAAAPYELGVELLFWGTLLPMRRMALARVVGNVEGISEPAILDLACGRGDFLKDLAATLPQAKLTGVDLSPDLLLHAKSQLPKGTVLLPASATKTRLAAGSQDCVVIGYLLHELPADVRREVLREARRVLKPDGSIVIYDATQLSEPNSEMRRVAEFMHGYFPGSFHEPYFQDYQRDDLQSLLSEFGFGEVRQQSHFLTTVVSARKA